jgi:hypothetical protein
MAASVSACVSLRNGWHPDSISYSTAPAAKMSERASARCPCACSGDMYPAVPISRPGRRLWGHRIPTAA